MGGILIKKITFLIIIVIVILIVSGITFNSILKLFSKKNENNNEYREIIWSTDQTITNDFIINEKTTLIINPGVNIYLSNSACIKVYGSLEAKGMPDNKIVFTKKYTRWWHIRIHSGSNVILEYCDISNGTNGIYISSQETSIMNCDIHNNNNYGIILYHAENCILKNNKIYSNNNYGIYMEHATNNIISGNYIYSTFYGIGIWADSDNNLITENHIYSNVRGIDFVSGIDNQIYYNNFITNYFHIHLSSHYEEDLIKNQWDNGAGEGNYWDDYNGLDNGANNRIANDGIGDTDIPHLGLDYYPFIKENGWLF